MNKWLQHVKEIDKRMGNYKHTHTHTHTHIYVIDEEKHGSMSL